MIRAHCGLYSKSIEINPIDAEAAITIVSIAYFEKGDNALIRGQIFSSSTPSTLEVKRSVGSLSILARSCLTVFRINIDL